MKKWLVVSCAALALSMSGLARAQAPAIDPNASALLTQADAAIGKLATFSANFTLEHDVTHAGQT
ncbi:MAG TPA: hypothetical protein VFW40_10155, partial [Capsulimonadaceae bacterium]|nr:hypothetical protein [Capsulimonadaceae bacterium]